MAGGSGLYVRAVCEGLDPVPPADIELREELRQLFEAHGIVPLQQRLKELDPLRYERIDTSNTQRLMRAIEIAQSAPMPAGERAPRNFGIIRIGIGHPREVLYGRINKRVDDMMEAGLLGEVRSLYPYRHLNALKTVGYKELFAYLEDKSGLQEAVDLVKQHTRNFAKRQLTWFRNDSEIRWLEGMDAKSAVLIATEGMRAG
jgi:tRNA dimethylallyltransferase